MKILITVSICLAYFGTVIGMYLILKKVDKDTDSDIHRWLSILWPLWVWLVPIIAIGCAVEKIFDKIDEDIH